MVSLCLVALHLVNSFQQEIKYEFNQMTKQMNIYISSLTWWWIYFYINDVDSDVVIGSGGGGVDVVPT